jgi:hypothetical protein
MGLAERYQLERASNESAFDGYDGGTAGSLTRVWRQGAGVVGLDLNKRTFDVQWGNGSGTSAW